MNLDNYDVIILDCDGVVFDSNLLKVDAFRKSLKNYDNNLVDKFSVYFKNNFGSSRYHFVKYFIENLLNIPFNQKLNDDILNEYARNCVELYKESEYTEYFLTFLAKYKKKKIYIASGGDEKELNKIFKEKKIISNFIQVLGSPRKKIDLIKDIILDNKDKKVIMIGDAESDFIASRKNGIDFIFMSQYSLVKSKMFKLSEEYDFRKIINLKELV